MAEIIPENIDRAVLYARRIFCDLAQPDEPNPPVSERIRTMKKQLENYPDVMVAGIYTDVRKMKASHPRPQFHQMIRDIQNGKYNCVVMYSLDTFGRDGDENRFYVRKLFVTLGLRIISLLDHYDSAVSEPEPGTFSRLEELIQFNHSINRSRMTAAHMKGNVLARRNDFPGVAYGYLFQPDSETKIVPDPETAQYVRYIFDRYLSGGSLATIAHELNRMGAITPSERKTQLKIYREGSTCKKVWSGHGVRSILTSRIYTGDIVHIRNYAPLYLSRDMQRQIVNEETVIKEGHHESIVTREQFEQVQTILRSRARPGKSNSGEPRKVIRVRLICGECGREMARKVETCNRDPSFFYVCSSYKFGLDNPCPPRKFSASETMSAIQEALEKERCLALAVSEKLRDDRIKRYYELLNVHYQAPISDLMEQGKQNMAELIALPEEESDRRAELEERSVLLRKKLVETINQKQEMRHRLAAKNSWVKLFSALEDGFDLLSISPGKYISQVRLYHNGQVVIQIKKQEERDALLACLQLLEGEPPGAQSTCRQVACEEGGKQWPEKADAGICQNRQAKQKVLVQNLPAQ